MTEHLSIEQISSSLTSKESWFKRFLIAYKNVLRNSSKKELYDLLKMIAEDWYYFNTPNMMLSEHANNQLSKELNDYWNKRLNEELKKSVRSECDGINFNPPFEITDYVDLKLRVYLENDGRSQYFAKDFQVAIGVATTMNRYYERFQDLSHWSTSRLWFAPVLEVDVDSLSERDKERLISAINCFHKFGNCRKVEDD